MGFGNSRFCAAQRFASVQNSYSASSLLKPIFSPVMLHVSGETFVQPDVCPIAASQQIAEPLVRQFMRIETVGALQRFGGQLRDSRALARSAWLRSCFPSRRRRIRLPKSARICAHG